MNFIRDLPIILIVLLMFSGCVLVSGNEKVTLNRTAVWANALYLESVKPEFYNNLSHQDITNLLDYNRQMWAFFVGASEGKSADDIMKEFNEIPIDSKNVIDNLGPNGTVDGESCPPTG